MKEKIALLNLSLDVPEGYIYVAKSVKMDGYNYIVKRPNFELLSNLFGNSGESEMVFEEDSEEWLVVLFDKNSFEEFENAVLDYFHGEQNAVSMMKIETAEKEVTEKETAEKESDVNSDVITIINYLDTISDVHIKRCFFSIMISLIIKEDQDPKIVDILYKYILDGLGDLANKDLSVAKIYLNDFMNKFAEVMKEEIK